MLFSIFKSSASTVVAVSLARVALMMAPHVENIPSEIFVIWNDFKSNYKISNQITLFVNQIIIFQIKSLYVIQ